MGVNITTKSGQILSAAYDGLYQSHTVADGILNGPSNWASSVVLNNGQVTFNTAIIMIACGRIVTIEAGTTVALSGTNDKIALKLSRPGSETTASLYSTSATSWTRQNINVTTGEYNIPILRKVSATQTAAIIPFLTLSGVFYGTNDPTNDFPYANGSLYVKYSA